jgi:hypothetical protein
MSTGTALVIIDVQVGLIEEAYRCNEVLDSINTLHGFRTDDHVITVKPTSEVTF